MDSMIRLIAAGFEALQDEYQKLHGQHQMLERKLATAREQYNELAKLYGTGQTATPPLSLASFPEPAKSGSASPVSVVQLISRQPGKNSREASQLVKAAADAVESLRSPPVDIPSPGVRIWGGAAADQITMPSIEESPLEQDFTVEGRPSKLACPFASMRTRRLSSHAASVLSRYNPPSASVCAASNLTSDAGRVDTRENVPRRGRRRSSAVDPIKAEKSPDNAARPVSSQGLDAKEIATRQADAAAAAGVCPIRFLDQHSPEEVATYFERHKHELPRSHEVCVRQHRTNADQIRQLDAKYGSLVSMIQGLGAKHKGMLPPEPDEDDGDDDLAVDGADEEDVALVDAASSEKVLKWASSIEDGDAGADAAVEDDDDDGDEDRQPHFERPLRDIRVGESPSRPWGISVPIKYLDAAQSDRSSKAVEGLATAATPAVQPTETAPAAARPAGKCPFGHGAAAAPGPANPHHAPPARQPETTAPIAAPTPAPRAMGTLPSQPSPQKHEARSTVAETSEPQVLERPTGQMLFTGPVFMGYSAEDAVKILRASRA